MCFTQKSNLNYAIKNRILILPNSPLKTSKERVWGEKVRIKYYFTIPKEKQQYRRV